MSSSAVQLYVQVQGQILFLYPSKYSPAMQKMTPHRIIRMKVLSK